MRGAKRFNSLIGLATIFLWLILFLPGSIRAQVSDSAIQYGDIERIEMKLTVNSDSSVDVEQYFEGLNPGSPVFPWMIDTKKFDGLNVEENGMKIDDKLIDRKVGDVTILKIPLSYYASGTNLKISWHSYDMQKMKGGDIFYRIIIFDRPLVNIGEVYAKTFLPDGSSDAASGQRFYAIHGILESKQGQEGENIIWYQINNANSGSTFTIEDSFKNPQVHFPFGSRIKFYFDSLNGISLVLFSLPLPLITLLILAYFDLRFRSSVKLRRNIPATNALPDMISPALLDLLYEGDITPRAISATITDLIRRGILLVVDKGDSITFGRKGGKVVLLPYEERILGELFKRQGIATNVEKLKELQAKEFIDPVLEKAYHDIYNMGARKGYFTRNPYRLKVMHHLAGIIIFLLSVIFFVLVIIYFPTKPLMLLPPFGMTVASLLIIYLAKMIPPRTPAGKIEVEKWLGFKKYLLGHHPISDEQNLALKYLPFAEVLGATEDWISHFKNLPAPVPDFYISASPYVSTEEWMMKTINASREVAQEIEELKGY
jgi:hypothetical protein